MSKKSVRRESLETAGGREKVIYLARSIRDDRILAEKLGIQERTLYRWMRESGTLKEDIDTGRTLAIKAALVERAVGGVRIVQKGMKLRDREYDKTTGKCTAERERIEPYGEEVYIPPDTQAMKFWLANRDRAEWTEQETKEAEKSLEAMLRELVNGGG